LRPLGIGEILDTGVKVVTRHWRPLVKSVVLIVLPLAVITTLLVAAIDPDQLELNPENSSPLGEEDATQLAGMAVSLFFGLLTFLGVTIACFKIVCDGWLGETPDVGRSLRFGLRRAWPALVMTLVWTAGVAVASLLIVPGIWLAVAWALALPALLFERTGPLAALGRSAALVQGRWWATFLLVLVGFVLVSLIGTLVSVIPQSIAEGVAPESAVVNAIAGVIGATVGGVILYPYSSALLTIMYVDQRVRKEGFDLQQLAEGVGIESPEDEPSWSSPGGWLPPKPPG
jgi:uncharacterized membrane protein YeaQ/YmgE (transglycosylase-associated protein family)